MHAETKAQAGAASLRTHPHAIFVPLSADKAEIGVVVCAEADDFGGAGVAGARCKPLKIGIVTVQYGGAAGAQPVKDFCLCVGDIVETVEEAGMAVGNAGDHCDIRLRDCAEGADLARGVHADFLDSVDWCFRQRGERERHTKMIVEAGAAGMATARLQQMREHFLASGLADRTGDRGKPSACRDMGLAPAGTEAGKGVLDVVDDKHRQIRIIGRARYQRRCRAEVGGGGDKVMAVSLCAGKGDKQAALAAAAAVDLDRRHMVRHSRSGPAAAGALCQCIGVDPHRDGAHVCSPPSVSRWMAFRATLESLKGSVSSPTSWKAS